MTRKKGIDILKKIDSMRLNNEFSHIANDLLLKIFNFEKD